MQQNRRSHRTGASLMIHITLIHTHTLAYYIRPVAHPLPQLCQRLSQTSSPRSHTHSHTHSCIFRQEGRGGEDKQAKEDGGQGTHTDKPDNRQETLESSRGYFLSSSNGFNFHFGGGNLNSQKHKQEHNENVK